MDRTEQFEEIKSTFACNAAIVPCREREIRALHHGDSIKDLHARAGEILAQIMQLEAAIVNNLSAYIEPQQFVVGRHQAAAMTEEDKDAFDDDVMNTVKKCNQAIENMTRTMLEPMKRAVMREHASAVAGICLQRVSYVTNASKSMQALRMNQSFLHRKRLLPQAEHFRLDNVSRKSAIEEKHRDLHGSVDGIFDQASPQISLERFIENQQSQTPLQSLDTTQEQLLARENATLFSHFEEGMREVREMESKMTEISSLMSQFSDKVMEQQTDIGLIYHHARETQSNLSQSSSILHSARQNGGGYGFIIFCIYAVASLVLELLHHIAD